MAINKSLLFQIFKYTIYALLLVNGVFYFFEGVNSADFVFDNELSWHDVMIAYSSVIDTAAWLVLLFAFELETYILDDDVLTGSLWWGMNAVVAVCYLIIVGAFYAYWVKTGLPTSFEAYTGAEPCSVAGQGASFVNTLDDYVALTAENCTQLSSGALYSADLNMFASPTNLTNLVHMTWVDVVNAGVWLVVVAMIQLEVFFESSRYFGTKFFKLFKLGKVFLYLILLACAVYWWALGGILEAWDAFIWLLAFFFIEMNVLNWQEEVAHERDVQPS